MIPSELQHNSKAGGCSPLPTSARVVFALFVMLLQTVHGQTGILGDGVRLHQEGSRYQDPLVQKPATADHFYGILGPVGQPGVYATPQPTMKLSDLVKAAGGTTADAASLVKIIRGGREGLQLTYSPSSQAQLMPGDVVVFERTPSQVRQADSSGLIAPPPARPEAPREVGVAFVGIQLGRPVIVSLPASVATIPAVINALHQAPDLIPQIRLIRTSRTAGRQSANIPAALVDGDILVFDSRLIDYDALARAQAFPEPFSVALSTESPGDSPSQSMAESQSDSRAVVVTRGTEELSTRHAPDSVQSDLEAPRFPDRPRKDLEKGPSVPAETLGADVPPAPQPVAAENDQQVVPTSLIELADVKPAQSLMAGKSPRPENRPWLSSQSRRPLPRLGNEFAAESFTRLSSHADRPRSVPMLPTQLAAADHSRRDGGTSKASQTTSADVPAPLDAADSAASGLGSRAGTLGLTVIVLACVFFAASVVWSRLDDSTGLRQDRQGGVPAYSSADQATSRHPQRETQLQSASSEAPRSTLDRLIENSLPVIEEQTSLPDRIDYHGEALGRRHIRLDTQHDVEAPHFAKRAPQSAPNQPDLPGKESLPLTQSNDRVPDRSADSKMNQTSTAGTPSTRGLLDRVLVAMEREKQR